MATNCDRRPIPLQVSLRTMLAAMAALSVCFLIGTKVGLIEGCGVGVTMILAVVFVSLKGHREAWVLRPFVAIVASLVVWFVGVDFSVFRTDCPACGLHWYDEQVRSFSWPLWRRKSPDHQDFFSLAAADLGHPCHHALERQQLRRHWGFVYVNPCVSGICCLSGGEWYFEPQREKMRALGKAQPQLGKEFHERVILQRDYVYCRDFVRRFRAEHDPTVTP